MYINSLVSLNTGDSTITFEMSCSVVNEATLQFSGFVCAIKSV